MNTENKTNKHRVKHGFPLVLPAQFTIKSLVQSKRGRVGYHTIYQRVQKALESGEVKPIGNKTPHQVRRGRKQIIFALTKGVAASATPAAAPQTV